MTEKDLERAVETIKKRFRVVGRDEELRRVLIAVMRSKHVLLEGPVGVGKTTIALAVAKFLDRPTYRVDSDERYTEHKLVGWFDPPRVLSKGYTREAFIPGPLTESMLNGGVLFINELNRMPEGTQNVLLPAMDERRIVIPKIGVVEAKPGFTVIATQNPEEFVGTSRLSEALRDRFVWVGLDYQPEAEEEAIVVKETGYRNMELVKLAVKVMRKTRNHPEIRRGSSIRGAIDFVDILRHHPNPLALPESTYVNAGIMALHNKIETQVRAKKSKEEIIREVVLLALKEAKEERPPKPPGSHEVETGAGRSSGIAAAVAGRGGVPEVRERSVLKHAMGALAAQSQEPSGESLAQTLKRAAESGLKWPILEAYSLLGGDLTAAERESIERIVSRIIALIAASIGEKGARKFYRKVGPFAPGLEEFDVELTLENYLGKGPLRYGDIAAVHRLPKRLAVSLMLDVSNSMQRLKVVTAAIAVAVLAHKLENDHYSVVAFKDEAEVLKSMMEPLDMEGLIGRILNLKTGGLTNIEEALKKGAEELESVQAQEPIGERMGIIVTDGWVTAGGDPRRVAGHFPRLHVLQVGIGGGMQESEDLAKDLAEIGGGEYIFVRDFGELPHDVMRIFR
jgi:gas vesicle protein GvpN